MPTAARCSVRRLGSRSALGERARCAKWSLPGRKVPAAINWSLEEPHFGHVASAARDSPPLSLCLLSSPRPFRLSDESVTTGREFFNQTARSCPHTWLNNCGGSIGFGMPVAIGAAIACPDQKVIALEGDGSAMYTVQALWTMARENLDITVLIFANQSYKILQGELTNVGVTNPGKSALEMLSLKDPSLDWVSVSRGMGVDGVRVDNIEDLVKNFKHGLKENGPFLIEVMI